LQLLQEQELQLPEQQLQEQGFMMNKCGWKEPLKGVWRSSMFGFGYKWLG
jgi:hypothetical protein